VLALSHSQIRRVALLSDSHGSVQEGVLKAIRDADLIVHAGDVGSSLVLNELAKIAPVVAVAGNNDQRSKWVRSEHATRHAKARQQFPYARCVVYGHSHRLVIDRDEGPWVANPGACGFSRTYGGANWLGLTVSLGKWVLSESRFD